MLKTSLNYCKHESNKRVRNVFQNSVQKHVQNVRTGQNNLQPLVQHTVNNVSKHGKHMLNNGKNKNEKPPHTDYRLLLLPGWQPVIIG